MLLEKSLNSRCRSVFVRIERVSQRFGQNSRPHAEAGEHHFREAFQIDDM